jgi:hypothetical protein
VLVPRRPGGGRMKCVLLCLLLVACIRPAEAAPPTYITVVIRNGAPEMAKVYMVEAGMSRRIGTAGFGEEEVVNVRQSDFSRSYLSVTTASGQYWISDNLLWVHPGDCIQLIIRHTVRNSGLLMCEENP